MSAINRMQHGPLGQGAELQMRLWALGLEVERRVDHERVEAERRAHPEVHPYVCISRETGAGGAQVARQVSEILGWQLLDRELLHYIAETGNFSESMLKYVDEARWNWLSDMIDWSIKQRTTNHSGYVIRLGRVLMTAASHSSAVIVGRGAQFLLPPEKGFTVRLIASRERRIQRVAEQRGCSLAEATRFVTATDDDRDSFVRQLLHHDPTDPHCYHLVINTDEVDLSEASDLIVSECRRRFETQFAGPELQHA